MSSSGIRAGRAFVEIGIDDKLSAGLARASARLRSFGRGLSVIGAGFIAAGGAIAAPLAAGLRVFQKYGDALDKAAGRTGFTVEQLSELGFAAEQSGASMEVLEKGIRRMQRTVIDARDGMATAVDALAALGLKAEDLINLRPAEQLEVIADRMAAIENPTLRAALAQQILGVSGTKLLPLLANGAAGLRDLRRQAQLYGLTVSTDAAKRAALFNDTLNIGSRVVRALTFQIGDALSPEATALIELFNRGAAQVRFWIEENQEAVKVVAAVALGLTAVGGGLIAVGVAAQVGAFALAGIAKIAGLVTLAFSVMSTVITALLSPIGLISVAVVGLGAAFALGSRQGQAAIGEIRTRLYGLTSTTQEVVGAMVAALTAGDVEAAGEVLWAAMQLIWEKGSTGLKNTVLDAMGSMQKIVLDIGGGLVKAWNEMIFGMQAAWIFLMGSVRTLTAQTGKLVDGFFARSGNLAAKLGVRARALFDENVDVEGEIAILDQVLEDTLGNIGAKRDAEAKRIQGETEKKIQAAQAKFNEAQSSVDAIVDGAKKEIDGESKAREADADAKLSQAKKKLDDAINAANAAVQKSTLAGDASAVAGGLASANGSLRDEVRSAFGGGDLRQFFGGSTFAERAAKAGEKTVNILEDIRDEVRDAEGAVFS